MTQPLDLTGQIIAFEEGELDERGQIDLFAKLVETGLAWKLQGSYGRAASCMITLGFIDSSGKVLRYPDEE